MTELTLRPSKAEETTEYESYCESIMDETESEAVVLLVINGDCGTGVSIQGSIEGLTEAPELLESMSEQLKKTLKKYMN